MVPQNGWFIMENPIAFLTISPFIRILFGSRLTGELGKRRISSKSDGIRGWFQQFQRYSESFQKTVIPKCSMGLEYLPALYG